MHLARFARRHYTEGLTPIEALPRLSSHLGDVNLYIKRDDLLGLAGGGNKTRKLEFLVADALGNGADTLITTGAVQSNHCRLTLAAAVKEGLKCRLVIEERVADSYSEDASGNNFLFQLLGVESVTVVPGGTDLAKAMRHELDTLAAEGRKGYIVPGGGSNALGALGYVSCAEEILHQTFGIGLKLDHVVCASGSGGTHSGLVAGFVGNNSAIPVLGISVRAKSEPQELKLAGIAGDIAKLLELPAPARREAFEVLDDYVGDGYSLPTDAMVEAVQLFAQLEGVLLDPVYTGKAAAGLIDQVRKGTFAPGSNVLFIHTGGAPALYAYQETVLGQGKSN